MEERHKIILNGVEVDDDFTGIIEERNGKLVGDLFGKSGIRKDVFKERTKAEAVRESRVNADAVSKEAKRTETPEKVPVTLNADAGKPQNAHNIEKKYSFSDYFFEVLREFFPD